MFYLLSWMLATAQGAATPMLASDLAAHTTLLTAHAEGAQLYECKSGQDGTLSWSFREPIASLFINGKTVGRHYAGPRWVLDDGSIIQGKMMTSTPGATEADIALLKLAVVDHKGSGALSPVTLVYRLNTHGGNLAGSCATAGTLRSVAYSADYVFAN